MGWLKTKVSKWLGLRELRIRVEVIGMQSDMAAKKAIACQDLSQEALNAIREHAYLHAQLGGIVMDPPKEVN